MYLLNSLSSASVIGSFGYGSFNSKCLRSVQDDPCNGAKQNQDMLPFNDVILHTADDWSSRVVKAWHSRNSMFVYLTYVIRVAGI